MSSTPSPLTRLLRYARPHRKQLWKASACSVLNKIFDLAPPALIGAAVDIIVEREDSLLAQLGWPDVQHQLWILVALTVFVWGMESIFEYAYHLLWRNLAQTIQHEMRLDAYGHIQTLEMAWFEERSTGGLMSVLNDDVNQLERFLDGGATALIHVATTVIIIGITYFYLAPSVAWVAFLPVPFVLWGSFWFQARIAPRYSDVRERVGLLNGQLANNLSGMATIKSFTREDTERARIHELSQDYRASNRRAINLSSAFSPLIRMVIVLGFTAILLLGGQLALDGQLAVGTYSVMIFLTQRLLWPLTRLGSTFDLYQRAMASTTRILNLLDTPLGIKDGDVALETSKVRGQISFKDVTFAYEGREPVLRSFSLDIGESEDIAIVGPTGAGKSTVIHLLQRFYEGGEGGIFIDGHDIKSLKMRDLRQAIGLVSQNVFLFYGTVAENIAYGSDTATREDIVRAAKQAEAHEFIEALPNGYDSIIGERGQRLSGGQRQRLSIARAIVKDPPVLILDEATSAVDNETEAAIQRSLEQVSKGRTTISIAHRLSTIRHADRILVLENGQTRESGHHDDLIALDGLYAQLWRVQTGQRAS